MVFLMFILGSILGSFYLVVGTRLPKGKKIAFDRSKCDHCGHVLRWYELIPIVSYTLQMGVCNNCGKKISVDHIVMEIATGLLFSIGYLYFGLNLRYLIYLVDISVALIIFVSDIKYMYILDSPIIIGSILIFIIRIFEANILSALISVVYGISLFAIMYLIKFLADKAFKRESLGGGDIKLAFLMGITLGYPNMGLKLGLISIVFASFLALPYAIASLYLNKKNELPFGPFLIASTVIIFTFIEKFQRLFIFFTL